MKRPPEELLREMARLVSAEEGAEMAIPSYLHKNPVLRAMAWARVEALGRRIRRAARSAGRGRLKRIIDFGCGSGVLFPLCAEVADEVIGVDIVLQPARLMIERARLDNVRVMTPDEMDGLEAGSADVVVAGEVLEHVEPLAPTIGSFRRILGGSEPRLLASLPTENALYRFGRFLSGFSGHYHHANARSIDEELTRSGFPRLHRVQIPLPGPFAIYWVLDYVPVGASSHPSARAPAHV